MAATGVGCCIVGRFAILGGLVLAFGSPLAALALVLAVVAGFIVLRH